MELRRLDADRPEHPLQRQLDQLLGLAHDVGMRRFIPQDREETLAPRGHRTCPE
jgi:hypothetical protein